MSQIVIVVNNLITIIGFIKEHHSSRDHESLAIPGIIKIYGKLLADLDSPIIKDRLTHHAH